ncbi:hypothetical protein [Actinokineospora fastidiosa]|uniref:Uncharacterized protein n=1 Tax=Actinokineospora fastidiosa TaxID=1816 RepID=A0A918GNI9_9PSEU|nr:hypothetical protein [Actinokineospora fastidiosa]GGS48941.1 hypothetical protein GCM10010171_50060 [Actinokineospora fastidiosa]
MTAVDEDRRTRKQGRLWRVALLVMAAAPAALALWQAARGSRTHVLLDYWHVLAKITDDQGGLVPGQVASYHLEQPFLVPSLIFWLDAQVLGGSNRALTVVTVALLAGVVVLLATMLPRALDPTLRAALTAGFSFLVFSPHALELWAQATTGSAGRPPSSSAWPRFRSPTTGERPGVTRARDWRRCRSGSGCRCGSRSRSSCGSAAAARGSPPPSASPWRCCGSSPSRTG